MLFATIYLPNFQLQAALRHARLAQDNSGKVNDTRSSVSHAAVLVGDEKKPVILQLNEAARAKGVHLGMSPSQGLARCLDLLILSPQPEQEAALQEILLEQAFTLSPYVEATAPGIATVQFMDPRNREKPILKVVQQLESYAISARAGIGSTPDISYLAAHLAKPLLNVENANEFLNPLPLEVLLENHSN